MLYILEIQLQTNRSTLESRYAHPGTAQVIVGGIPHGIPRNGSRIDRNITQVVKGEEVLQGSVNPELLDIDLLGEGSRESIPQGDVLEAQVSHVQQVTILDLHVEGSAASSLVVRGRIESIGTVFTPEVACKSLRNGTVGRVEAWDGQEAFSPDITLAHTLDEEGSVHTLEIKTRTESVFITRCRITDNLQVAVVGVSVGILNNRFRG